MDRIKGSHHILVSTQDENYTVIVPVHSNKDLKTGTLRSILKQVGLSIEDLEALL